MPEIYLKYKEKSKQEPCPGRKKVMPEDQKRHNREVKTRLRFRGGVPAIILLDENGNRIGQIRGCRPLNDFMKNLKQAAR